MNRKSEIALGLFLIFLGLALGCELIQTQVIDVYPDWLPGLLAKWGLNGG